MNAEEIKREALEEAAQIAEKLFPPTDYNKAGGLIAQKIRERIAEIAERGK